MVYFFHMVRKWLISLVFSLVLFMPGAAFAQDFEPGVSREVLGTVTRINIGAEGQMGLLVAGDDGESYAVDPSLSHSEGLQYEINKNDRVILQVIKNMDGTETAYFADVLRTKALIWILLFFAVIVMFVGRARGVMALLGFVLTIGILFWFVFPHMIAGDNPVPLAVGAGIVILAINLSLAHGLTRSTGVALLSTSLGVLLAWAFSAIFVGVAQLSGLSSEESVFLYWQMGGVGLPEGLLLAGIILGTVGVLDDVAITQCETVAELRSANQALRGRELFTRAMRVGRHHIASTVNTLVLAYAGASLPLFLIFLSSGTVSFTRFINTEAVAEEIIRTLAGTSALVLTVPIATALAAFVWSRAKKNV